MKEYSHKNKFDSACEAPTSCEGTQECECASCIKAGYEHCKAPVLSSRLTTVWTPIDPVFCVETGDQLPDCCNPPVELDYYVRVPCGDCTQYDLVWPLVPVLKSLYQEINDKYVVIGTTSACSGNTGCTVRGNTGRNDCGCGSNRPVHGGSTGTSGSTCGCNVESLTVQLNLHLLSKKPIFEILQCAEDAKDVLCSDACPSITYSYRVSFDLAAHGRYYTIVDAHIELVGHDGIYAEFDAIFEADGAPIVDTSYNVNPVVDSYLNALFEDTALQLLFHVCGTVDDVEVKNGVAVVSYTDPEGAERTKEVPLFTTESYGTAWRVNIKPACNENYYIVTIRSSLDGN